jgi:hypothetical protein
LAFRALHSLLYKGLEYRTAKLSTVQAYPREIKGEGSARYIPRHVYGNRLTFSHWRRLWQDG